MPLFPRRLRIVLALAVIAVLVVVFLLPGFRSAESGFRFAVVAEDPQGQEHVVYDESNFWQQSVITIDGVVVSKLKLKLEFRVTSATYDQATLFQPSDAAVLSAFWFTNGETTGPVAAIDTTVIFPTGSWHNVCAAVVGNCNPPAGEPWGFYIWELTAEEILSTIGGGEGTHIVVFTATLGAKAVGAEPVPTDTWSGTLQVTFTVSAGDLSLEGTLGRVVE